MQQRRKGQGITEYVIVVGVIAIGLVGAIKALGLVMERTYGKVTGALEDVGLQIDVGADPGGAGSAPPSARRAVQVRSCSHPEAQVDAARGYCGACDRYL
jgi:Flp pilus assembly pilin Flp